MHLRISGIAAFGLPDADKEMGEGSSDPFVVFTFHIGGVKYTGRTATIQNATRQPVWKEAVRIEFPDADLGALGAATLDVSVWDEDVKDANDLMGAVRQITEIKRAGERLGKIDAQGHHQLNDFKVAFAYAFETDAMNEKKPEKHRQTSPLRHHIATPRAYSLEERFRHSSFMEARKSRRPPSPNAKWRPPSPLSPASPTDEQGAPSTDRANSPQAAATAAPAESIGGASTEGGVEAEAEDDEANLLANLQKAAEGVALGINEAQVQLRAGRDSAAAVANVQSVCAGSTEHRFGTVGGDHDAAAATMAQHASAAMVATPAAPPTNLEEAEERAALAMRAAEEALAAAAAAQAEVSRLAEVATDEAPLGRPRAPQPHAEANEPAGCGGDAVTRNSASCAGDLGIATLWASPSEDPTGVGRERKEALAAARTTLRGMEEQLEELRRADRYCATLLEARRRA